MKQSTQLDEHQAVLEMPSGLLSHLLLLHDVTLGGCRLHLGGGKHLGSASPKLLPPRPLQQHLFFGKFVKIEETMQDEVLQPLLTVRKCDCVTISCHSVQVRMRH